MRTKAAAALTATLLLAPAAAHAADAAPTAPTASAVQAAAPVGLGSERGQTAGDGLGDVLAAGTGGSLASRAEYVLRAWEEDPIWIADVDRDVHGETVEEIRPLIEEAEPTIGVIIDSSLSYEEQDTLAKFLIDMMGDGDNVVLVLGSGRMLSSEVSADDEDRRAEIRSQIAPDGIPGYFNRNSPQQNLTLTVERLADPQPVESKRSYGPLDRAYYAVVYRPVRAIVVTVVVLAVIFAALWFFVPRGSKKRRYRIPKAVAAAAASADRGAMRRALGDDALSIVERLEKLQTGDLDADTAAEVEEGLDAYALARRISDDPDAKADDLAGALVLLSRAEDAVAAAESASKGRGRRKAVPTVLCAVDPRHGASSKRADVEVAGRGEKLQIPMCGKCRHDKDKGNPLQWLTVDGAPYPGRRTVWAETLFGATKENLVDAVTAARAGKR